MKVRLDLLIAIAILPLLFLWKSFWGDGVDIGTYKEQLGYINLSDFYYAKEFIAWLIIWMANYIDSDAMAIVFSCLLIVLSFKIMGLKGGLAFTLAMLSVPGILFTNNVMRQGAAALFFVASNILISGNNRYKIFAIFSHNSVMIPIVLNYALALIVSIEKKAIAIILYFIVSAAMITAGYYITNSEIFGAINKYGKEIFGDSLIEAWAYLLYFILLSLLQFAISPNKINLLLNIMIAGALVLMISLFPVWVSTRIVMYYCLSNLVFVYFYILSSKILFGIRVNVIGMIIILFLVLSINMIIVSGHGGAWSILWK
jgi:hypothetical protein